MNVVIIDDDQLVALSLQTILEACDDIQVSATGGSRCDQTVRRISTGCSTHGHPHGEHKWP